MLYHKDHAQDIYFRTNKAKTVLVGATGSNDFGSFLSLGICDGVASIKEINAGKEFTLTLGRRYLEEEDIRSSWKANAEIRECLKIFSFPKESLHHSAIFQLPTLDAAPVLKTAENAKKRKGTKGIAEHQTTKKIKVENRKETTDTVKLAWGTYDSETDTVESTLSTLLILRVFLPLCMEESLAKITSGVFRSVSPEMERHWQKLI